MQDYRDALDDIDRPAIVLKEISDRTIILDDGFLDDEVVTRAKSAPVNSPLNRTYLAWRRRTVVNLHKSGFDYGEIASMMNVSTDVVYRDIAKVRANYEKIAVQDWGLAVAERVMQLDDDIHRWRRRQLNPNMTINTALRIDDHILKLEDKRDRLLGLEKAASAQHETTTNLNVELSFAKPTFVREDFIDVAAIDEA